MKNRQPEEPGLAAARAGSTRSWWYWLDAVPAAWMALVLSAYGLLARQPVLSSPLKSEVPGIPEADRLALPFLVATVTAGIIRYVCARRAEGPSVSAPLRADGERRDTA